MTFTANQGRDLEGLPPYIMPEDNNVLAIDPSSVATGWAVMRPGYSTNNTLLRSGCWHPSKAEGKLDRFDQLANHITSLVRDCAVTDVVVETPSGGQRHSATQLMVYARAVGVCEAAAHLAGAKVHRISVQQWKGNARKSDTGLVRYRFPSAGTNHNELDAVALCDKWLAVLRPYSGNVPKRAVQP